MPEQQVRVSSGVGLGVKIALGFMLFSFLTVAGTCAMCGACFTAGVAASAAAAGPDGGSREPVKVKR